MAFTIREQRPADASDGPDLDARQLHHSIESEFLALLTGPPPEAVRVVVEGDRLQVTGDRLQVTGDRLQVTYG